MDSMLKSAIMEQRWCHLKSRIEVLIVGTVLVVAGKLCTLTEPCEFPMPSDVT